MGALVYMEDYMRKISFTLLAILIFTLAMIVPAFAEEANVKKIIPQYSLEGLMLKLKLQYFGHLIHRADSGKDPDAGKD